MRKDLFIGGSFILAAAVAIAAVVIYYGMQTDDNAPKTIRPKSEPIAKLQVHDVKETPKKTVEPVKKIRIKEVSTQPEPKTEPLKNQDPPPVEKKIEPAPKDIVKVEPEKKDPLVPIKIEPKKDPPIVKTPTVKEIVLGNLTKLNNPDGEYAVNPLNSEEVFLIGKVKTLRIGSVNTASLLDASGLDAQEIIFAGDINGKSKVLVHAPGGTVSFQREINGRSQIDVIAPEGKVVFKSTHASIINGESKLTIVAKDVLFLGDINGTQTTVDVTLTQGGSLKFLRILGGVRLHYGRADARDPEPRLDSGVIGPTAQLRKIEPGKK